MSLKYSTSTIGTLLSLLLDNKKPVLLLGAGCSIKSGIPTASEFVEKAGKWGYARENGLPPKIASIRRSDWFPWLTSRNWYNANLSPADNYPLVVENLLQPKAVRKEFLRDVLTPQVPPSIGYEKLADLIGLKVFQTILTTNFDGLIASSCHSNSAVHGHNLIKNKDEIIKISTNPHNVQIVHLHGDIETYTDKNLIDETNTLDAKLIERLIPILRDNPLVVIGYRGAEDSIMKSLLFSQKEKMDNFPNGIYWCHYDKSSLEDIPNNVRDLATTLNSNFQLIKTPSFDDVIDKIWYEYTHQIKKNSGILAPLPVNINPIIHDLLIITTNNWKFDEVLLRQRIVSYCESLNVYKPDNTDENWFDNFKLERDLTALDKNSNVRPTFAGYSLFGSKIQEYYSEVSIEVTITKDDDWLDYIFDHDSTEDKPEFNLNFKIDGNLWEQLDEILDILSQFNKTFRLKGEISKDVLPYPPLALKELIVNALVHRDYRVKETIKVNITPERIEIINPGGITKDLKNALSQESILVEITRGKRGYKSYRNPVIADFFYGGGAMDKAGSGLSDVYNQVIEYNSKVLFGPTEDNKKFIAEIYARPESIDSITKTAKTNMEGSAFVSNMLEILRLPKTIYTSHSNELFDKRKFYDDYKGIDFPPFHNYRNEIIQFYPFEPHISPLSNFIEPSLTEALDFDEFQHIDGNRNTVIKLLNKTIQKHLTSLGLVVDWKKQRAYFPKEYDSENRTISYQARIKKATRTVAKQIINKKTDKVLYWEHKSVNYEIKKFDDIWVLVLLPGYVFTVNGDRWLVKSDKISKLATKRSSIDYNKSVLNDLYFWSNIISNGQTNSFWLQYNNDTENDNMEVIKISSLYPKLVTNKFQDYDSLEGFDYEDLDDIESELANEINDLKNRELK